MKLFHPVAMLVCFLAVPLIPATAYQKKKPEPKKIEPRVVEFVSIAREQIVLVYNRDEVQRELLRRGLHAKPAAPCGGLRFV